MWLPFFATQVLAHSAAIYLEILFSKSFLKIYKVTETQAQSDSTRQTLVISDCTKTYFPDGKQAPQSTPLHSR